MNSFVKEEDILVAIEKVLSSLTGIEKLHDSQMNVLKVLINEDNSIFLTAPTNSGKTLPPMILPSVMKELNQLGYSDFPMNGRVLFITAMNSIQQSLVTSMKKLGITCDSVKRDNIKNIFNQQIQVLFISPETLKQSDVFKHLLQHREDFVLTTFDEAHLSKLHG